MRLHVAAQAFPTVQGTQTIIRAMLEAELAAGIDSALLAYPSHAATDLPFRVFRPRASVLSGRRALLRSGPSAAKVVLDVQLAVALRRLLLRHRPSVIVAHHVEAAASAILIGAKNVVFFSHTDLAEELPTYARRLAAWPLRAAGGALDRGLMAACAKTLAISPLLADRLSIGRYRAHYVPPPFFDDAQPMERACARAELGITADASVLVYAGNLDGYQGIERLPQILRALRRHGLSPLLLVATESDPASLIGHAQNCGVMGQMRIVPLAGALQRSRIYAAADLALVPRRAEGGLPIKLLDAMAHGVPVVMGPAATAGLAVGHACAVAQGDTAEDVAAVVARLVGDPAGRRHLAAAGQTYVRTAHAPECYLEAMGRQLVDLP